jgi:hypothetical protein
VKHFFENFVGKPGQITNSVGEQGQAVSAANTASRSTSRRLAGVLPVRVRRHHPLLFLGSVLGRIKFSAWCLLVPLWSTFVYGVDAFLLWGGGYFAQEGALDFSGGSSSTCRPVSRASWPPGSRTPLLEIDSTPYPTTWSWRRSGPASCGSAGTASTVVTRTTPGPPHGRRRGQHQPGHRVGVLTWMAMDAWLSKAKKPTFLGGVNGMICGLVGITPCAGWVNGWGAIAVGVICTAIVWFAWNYLSKVRPFSKVDDALGVIYTHGIAGFFGGLLLGIFGDPNMLEYGCGHLNAPGRWSTPRGDLRTAHGLYAVLGERPDVHGLGPPALGTVPSRHLRHLLVGAVTFILMKLIGLVLRGSPSPLQGRDPRDRRPGHPRRGGLPRGDVGRAGRGRAGLRERGLQERSMP